MTKLTAADLAAETVELLPDRDTLFSFTKINWANVYATNSSTALNVLTLGVAGFAMFSSLLTLASLRLPQLAPVWALGLRRRDLAWLEFIRTLALWFITFVAAIPAPLGIGTVELEDGSSVKGFICEPAGIADATDITHHGGWINYLNALNKAPQ